MNRAITIAAEDRGTNIVFVATDVAAGYAWNSFLVDGTDILCSVPIIGQKLRSPLDTNLSDFTFTCF